VAHVTVTSEGAYLKGRSKRGGACGAKSKGKIEKQESNKKKERKERDSGVTLEGRKLAAQRSVVQRRRKGVDNETRDISMKKTK